ncbi:MAG: DNA mismatch repair endonuclease MutL [Bacteroidales bacterium]|nr:DNA mismatch repair endonuclease MutL [Bacteroidales bacterium]
MSLIQLLPEHVANQIAAGEVVNRPASAVKELLENAVDAGADDIHLLVRDAGKTLIQVIDNGCGMSAEDAVKCFLRHATSKIRQADDLYTLKTMGFRGEALASIAAVACVELKTKRAEDETGSLVCMEGEKQAPVQACACPNGTQISVKNIYFNTPARRQFLKTDEVEYRYIEEEFVRVAMAHPEIKWRFTRDEKQVYHLEPGTFRQRIVQLMGRAFEQRLVRVHESAGDVDIDGFICTPEYTTRNRSKQYVFVNTRYVKHIGLSHAIETAYRQLVPEKNYPAYFLRLAVKPETIDVNIHPTKTEIRFDDEKLIYGVLLSVVKHAIGVTQLAPALDFDNVNDVVVPTRKPLGFPEPPRLNLDPNYDPFAVEYRQGGKKASYASDVVRRGDSLQAQLQFYKDTFSAGSASAGDSVASVSPDSADAELPVQGRPTRSEMAIGTSRMSKINAEPGGAVRLSAETLAAESDLGNKFMQFALAYIVSTVKSGLLFVDQQAASERIIYERYMKSRRQNETQVGQRILFPQTIQLAPAQSEVLKEIREKLALWGWEIEWVGGGSFIVNAVPAQTREEEIASLIENTVDDYIGKMMNVRGRQEDNVAAALARQTSVRHGQVLSREEMMSLINGLFASSCPHWSPSGRRTYWIMPESDIRQAFTSNK